MKWLWLSVILTARLGAQAPVISPAAPKAAAGQAVQFTANRSVTWSLAPGSIGSINALTGLYVAPSSIPVKQAAGGCQVYPASSIFNTRVDALPVHPSSAAWIALIPANTKATIAPNIGTNIITNATPSYPIHSNYTPGTDGSYRIPSWPDLKMEGGVFTSPLGNLDRHIASVNKDTCEFSEIYNFYPIGTATVLQCPTCTAQSAAKYDGNALSLLTTGATDAAGLPLQPFQLRLQDFLGSGEITHMSRYTMGNHIIGPFFVWPATANAAAPFGSVPYGSILRLNASVDISGYSAIAQKILTAWKHYGMILADGGSTIDVSADTDVHLNPDIWNAIEELRLNGPTIGHYEFVNQSALMVSASSSAVKYDNGYQTPTGLAVVIAEDNLSRVQTKVYIALQGVTVGTTDPAMFFQAGAPATQLTSWVNGSTNHRVTWTMSQGVGTLTPDGQYTPPSNVDSPTVTILTGTAAADSSARVFIRATIWPAGAIRVNVGNTTSDITDNDQIWYREFGWDSGQSFVLDGSGLLPNGTNPIYVDSRYTGGDQIFRFNLANGNYKLKIKNGLMYGPGGPVAPNDFVSTYDAQGQIVYHQLNTATLQSTYNTPATDIEMPVWVQDGTAYFAIRQLADSVYNSTPARHCTISGSPVICHPQMSAFTLAPDNTPPHLTIDGSTASITVRKTRQFYAIGWYMPNAATWTMVSGPGDVNSTGLYTAPAAPPQSDTTVTIRATSIWDATITATVSFTYTFGTIVVTPDTATLVRGLTWKFSASVNDVEYSNVTWLVSPEIGSINRFGMYTAPTAVSSETEVTITAQSTEDSTKSGSATITILPVMPPIRVNCGHTTPYGDFTDAAGHQWVHDYAFYPEESADGTHAYSTRKPVANTTEDMQVLYQSHRYMYTGGQFYYQFAVPDGAYRVTLKFADFDFPEPGHYVMDVKVNGVKALSAFDPDVKAGGVNRARDETFVVQISGQTLRIDFIGNGNGWPSVSGIEILPATTDALTGARVIRGKTVTKGKSR